MKITKNTIRSVCPLCEQPMEIGALGANYLPNSTSVRRGHPGCVSTWKKSRQRESLYRPEGKR